VLTPLGRLQAAATGARLRARLDTLGCDPPSVIVHSSMTRAVQTAQIIRDTGFPHLSLACDPDLREGAPQVPDPNWWRPSLADVRRDSVRIERAFRRYFHRAVEPAAVEESPPLQPGNTEGAAGAQGSDVEDPPSEAVICAAAAAMPELSTPVAPPMSSPCLRHTAEVYVCHGNVIRWLVLRALQLPTEAWLRIVVPHGSVTTLAITSEGDVLLQGLGESGHIDADLVT
jgi:serine/threonine-protein phosphatase PGAM5